MPALVLIPLLPLPPTVAIESSTGGMPPEQRNHQRVTHQSTFTNFERDVPIIARDRCGRQSVPLLSQKMVRAQKRRRSSIHCLPLD